MFWKVHLVNENFPSLLHLQGAATLDSSDTANFRGCTLDSSDSDHIMNSLASFDRSISHMLSSDNHRKMKFTIKKIQLMVPNYQNQRRQKLSEGIS